MRRDRHLVLRIDRRDRRHALIVRIGGVLSKRQRQGNRGRGERGIEGGDVGAEAREEAGVPEVDGLLLAELRADEQRVPRRPVSADTMRSVWLKRF